MIYFAHRGASAHRVQNTVEAFALARAEGATCYELDVHLLRDGELVVHHDYSLLSTAGTDIPLQRLTSAELKNYPLQNPFTATDITVPLLQEIIPVVASGLKLLNIELKNDQNVYPGIEKRLWEFLQNYPQLHSKILFSSFDYQTLARLRTLAPSARIGLLTRQFKVQQALNLGAESVHINHMRLTPQIIRACQENHLKLYCYTVNDVCLAKQLETQGIDGIFTDDITIFRL